MPTSEAKETFVYLQLPGTLEVLTCGRFEQRDGIGRYVYGKRYLADPRAVPVDPFDLPLQTGTFETASNGGIFGALRDASPDSWGRRIIERQLGRADLTEIDFLLHSPEDRIGALSFGSSPAPPAPVHRFNQVLQLDLLTEEADRIEAGEAPRSAQVLELVQAGSSLGGARPKNVVEDAAGLWVAKFPSRNDRFNQVAAEAAMLALAKECGLSAPEFRVARVGRKDVLLVHRFDRRKVKGGYLRHRMVSALTVLRAEEGDRGRWSYPGLADELMRWSDRPDEDLRELFLRIAFNALINNIDDHPRNHALVAERAGFRLSPVYDVTPFPSVSLERDLAMRVSQSRRATRQNLLSVCERFRLAPSAASNAITRMKGRVARRWRPLAEKFGATKRDLEILAPAFVHDGFEFVAG